MAKMQYLIFENEYGGGDMVSEEDLETLMKSADQKIKLIFIAACDSEQIGMLFRKFNVEHIICIKDKRYVLDEVAIKFTQTFYKAVFTGKPVCEAFKRALQATQFNVGAGCQNEVNLFQLLKGSDHVDVYNPYAFGNKVHECNPLPLASRGDWQCISEHNLIK